MRTCRCHGWSPRSTLRLHAGEAVTHSWGEDVSGNKLLSADVTAVKYHFMSCQAVSHYRYCDVRTFAVRGVLMCVHVCVGA